MSINNLFSVENKVILVTGASRGIGNYIAESLHNFGAIVYGFGRTSSTEINSKFKYKSLDITKYHDLLSCVNEIYKIEKRIDILINAAGITLPTKSEKYSRKDFFSSIKTNLLATNDFCQLVSGIMKKNNKGVILNISSIGSKLGFPNNPGYISSKTALVDLTKSLSIDLAPFNIRVNNLAPGYIKTDMTMSSYLDSTKNKERVDRMIIKRWGQPYDLLGGILFLVSDASSYVTGIDLIIDGGWTAKGI